MKYLGFILVVVVGLVVGQVLTKSINEKDSKLKQSRATPNEKFRQALEKLRLIMINGNSSLGIPVLDPYRLEKIALEFNEDFFRGTIHVSNFNVTGLAGFKIDKAEIALFSRKIVIGLTWPRITSYSLYNLKSTIFKDIKFYGEGAYTADLTNLSFLSTVSFGVIGGVSIKKMETKVSLGALEFSASGLFNDPDTSKIISDLISDMAPHLLQDFQTEVTTAINEIIIKKGNAFLAGKSIADIIGSLG